MEYEEEFYVEESTSSSDGVALFGLFTMVTILFVCVFFK